MYEIGAAIIGGLFLLVSVWWGFVNDKKVKSFEKQGRHDNITRGVFESISDFDAFNKLRNAVDEVFDKTKADRFLVLVAVNKKDEFNDITVVYEQHEKGTNSHNAVSRYHHVSVDDQYRSMLKDAERTGPVLLEVADMEDCILKTFYNIEGVKHSKVTFLTREVIDDKNDAVVFSSMATHSDEAFTEEERVQMRIAYEGKIIPVIRSLFT